MKTPSELARDLLDEADKFDTGVGLADVTRDEHAKLLRDAAEMIEEQSAAPDAGEVSGNLSSHLKDAITSLDRAIHTIQSNKGKVCIQRHIAESLLEDATTQEDQIALEQALQQQEQSE